MVRESKVINCGVKGYNIVQHSPPVSQSVLQQEKDLDLPIALRRSKRSCGPPNRLIEKCNLTYYVLSCGGGC